MRRGQTHIHAGRRHARAEEGGGRQVQARERARLRAEPDHRQHRRQAGALQRLHGDAQRRRRGHHPRALLGLLSRDRDARRGHAGHAVNARRTTASSCAPRSSSRRSRPKTKWLILNSPSNPTGAAYTASELRALADVLLRHPACLGADRRHVRAPDLSTTSSSRPSPRSSPSSIPARLTMNGVSKAYCMTGWRIGFAGGPTELIKAMTTVQSQSTSNAVLDQPGRRGRGAERPAGFHPEAQRRLPGAARPGRGGA